ncbi:MAG: hypothetical protein IT373_01960 [Polyangiaceae bacterium]|nr:hypothetical protein [Polyangiaceae bacterium]
MVVEDCPLEPALSADGRDPIHSIALAGERLFVADGTKELRAYAVKPGCKLVLDDSFADHGELHMEREIALVTADAQGNVMASNGVFDSYLLRGGKSAVCGRNYVALHPSGAWGLTSFANSTVNKLTLTGDKCALEPWALRDLGDDAKRVGPFTNVSAIGFARDLTLVGGVLASGAHVVVGYDAAGNEKLRFGNEAQGASPDVIGWVHAVAGCAPGFCVADANYRAISVWSKEGKFVGRVLLEEILEGSLPWNQTATEQNGKLLVGISQRPKAGPVVARVVRLVFSERS